MSRRTDRSALPAIPITDEELLKFCDLLYRQTGIRLSDRKRYFMEHRIVDRVHATGLRSFGDYFTLLHRQETGEEMQQIVNQMTVNETYFFREHYQFDCLVNHLLDAIVAGRRKGSPLRIWSVPCSTGEEPYSLAITLLERWPRAREFAIEIHGSDIDTAALAKARAGIYDERALHRLPPAYRSKYFRPAGDARWQIIEELRACVDFTPVNVTQEDQTRRFSNIDVIFCRNLLIYFDEVSRRQAAEMFHKALVPGGFLCLGHSETMSRHPALFVPRKFPDARVYQKLLPGSQPA